MRMATHALLCLQSGPAAHGCPDLLMYPAIQRGQDTGWLSAPGAEERCGWQEVRGKHVSKLA